MSFSRGKILDYIKKHNKVTLGDIQRVFKVRGEEGSKQLEAFLDEMCTSGLLYFNKYHYIIFPKKWKIGTITIDPERHYSGELKTSFGKVKIQGKNVKAALSGDTVIVRDGVVREILTRKETLQIGDVYLNERGKYMWRCRGNKYIKIPLRKPVTDQVELGQLVAMNIYDTPAGVRGDFAGIVTDLDPEDANREIYAIAHKYGFRDYFTEAEQAQLDEINLGITEEEIARRDDHRADLTFTIDDITAMDLDDALSIDLLENGNYLIKGHIAHPSHYIPVGSPLYNRGKRQNFTGYFGGIAIHLFGKKLANYICSLSPNEDRLAKTTTIELTPEGVVVDYTVQRHSVIRSKKKCTYYDVNKVIDGEDVPGYEDFHESIFNLKNVSDVLELNRTENGAITFNIAEIQFKFDAAYTVREIGKREEGASQSMIESIMILINTVNALDAILNDRLTLYRNHKHPSESKVNYAAKKLLPFGIQLDTHLTKKNAKKLVKHLSNIEQLELADYLKTLYLMGQEKAYYATENVGHYGLGIKADNGEGYIHSTAPIRRFADFQDQIMHDKYMNGEIEDYVAEKKRLDKICEHISERERHVIECEREVDKMLMAKYMHPRIGEEFEGFVIKIGENGEYLLVKLDIGPVCKISRNDIHLGDSFVYHKAGGFFYGKNSRMTIRVGDEVRTKLKSASVSKGNINLYLKQMIGKEKPLTRELRQ